jgi:hypothetical protein
VRAYSTTPTAHIRDLQSDGVTASAQRVYTAIADRQTSERGECFRSNSGIGKELGLHKNTVSRAIAQLKAKRYLSVWYINGGRRMRVSTLVSRGVSSESEGGKPQGVPYKENNIKKTLQQKKCVVSSVSLSENNRVLFGELEVNELVATFGVKRVERGLLAFDAANKATIDNPIGWLKKAIVGNWKPKKASATVKPFTECSFEHTAIINKYRKLSNTNEATIAKLLDSGLAEGRIAHRIWKGTI